MKHLLIVEDDRDLSRGLCLALKSSELQITQCHDLKGAREQLRLCAVDLVILDINLPDGSGLDLLCELRRASGVPVILLTANDTEMDVVTGLEHGADDYIVKPFSLAILRARVNAQLRRTMEAPFQRIVIDNFVFDFDRLEFSYDGVVVELSKTEQKLLRILVENRGVTLTRADLVDRIWTNGADYVDENALSVTVKRLRDKLGAGQYIKTVYGLGYVWTVN